ncbi:MAG TPA: hypothetical protein PL037_06245, partial [Elusimicrobiales bacterium]|nr:hypothetical protein [Elusimicrobiales bacterium]
MKDLPEINFSEKKRKRKGFIPWIQARLGIGSRGFMGGSGPGASMLGRAAIGGGSRFGAASGLGAMLTGKAALITIAAVITAAVGAVVYVKAPAPQTAPSGDMSARAPDYVPAILRERQERTSSLEMFA